MLAVTVEHQCLLLAGKQAATNASLARLAPTRVIDFRIHVRIKTVLARCAMFQLVLGRVDMKRILTMLLIPLNPYFQGTTSRMGAPFWLGMALP